VFSRESTAISLKQLLYTTTILKSLFFRTDLTQVNLEKLAGLKKNWLHVWVSLHHTVSLM